MMTGQPNYALANMISEVECYLQNIDLMDHPEDSEVDLTGFYLEDVVASKPRDEDGNPIFDDYDYSYYHAQCAKNNGREFYSIYGVSVENFIDGNNEVDEAACKRHLNDRN